MPREVVRAGRIPFMPPRDSERRPFLLSVALMTAVAAAIAVGVVWSTFGARPPLVTAPAPAVVPAATIVRLPGRDIAVINRGLGDGMVPASVFRVYDRATGLPAPSAGATLPAPKAWLEVVRIGPGFSECRIIQRAPGVSIFQGDPVIDEAAAVGSPPVQPVNSGQTPPLPGRRSRRVDANPGRS